MTPRTWSSHLRLRGHVLKRPTIFAGHLSNFNVRHTRSLWNSTYGPMGVHGPMGYTGLLEYTGQWGNTGPVGVHGPMGVHGAHGGTRAHGVHGPMGYTGLLEYTGPWGTRGQWGNTGPWGTRPHTASMVRGERASSRSEWMPPSHLPPPRSKRKKVRVVTALLGRVSRALLALGDLPSTPADRAGVHRPSN